MSLTSTATKQQVVEEAEEKKTMVVGSKNAASLVSELRGTFSTGKTRSYEWRTTQIKNIIKLVEERESDIFEALRSDLSKPELESFVSEVLNPVTDPCFRLKIRPCCVLIESRLDFRVLMFVSHYSWLHSGIPGQSRFPNGKSIECC